ncbi:Surfeit locus protein 1 [Zea mays]|uniref:SURF1-like protein n=1 Tax=Zea mays TaxID=4577 RepID=A0A1D6EPK7_MAIZE|nr:Surfeit locus protein 1 [Zea mays]
MIKKLRISRSWMKLQSPQKLLSHTKKVRGGSFGLTSLNRLLRRKIYASYLLQFEKPRMPPVRVVGVIRGSEKPSIFVPANEPNSGQWFYVDVPMIARACGLPENTIYIEDINEDVSPTNPYPVPQDVNTLIRHSVMPDDHLKYTFTWYTFNPKLIANLQVYYILIC